MAILPVILDSLLQNFLIEWNKVECTHDGRISAHEGVIRYLTALSLRSRDKCDMDVRHIVYRRIVETAVSDSLD